MLLPAIRLALMFIALTPSFALGSNYNISGFIGIGGEHMDNPAKDDTQGFLESGVRMSVEMPKNFTLNAQALYTHKDIPSGNNLDLDYATIDWQFSDAFGEQKVSLGRFKANGGIYSNTQDMPFTRPSIQLSESVYGDGFRSIYNHIDGIKTDFSYSNEFGTWNLELGYGSHQEDEILRTSALGHPEDVTIYDADRTLLVDLNFQTLSILTNFTYRKIESDTPFEVAQITVQRIVLESYIASLQYLTNDWEFTLESILQDVSLAKSHETETAFGYYFQTRYFFTPELTILLRFDQSDQYNSEINPSSTENRYRITTTTIDAYTLGVSWRPAEQWQLSAEVHQLSNRTTSTLVQLAWRF